MTHLFCRLGIHKFRDLWRGDWNGWEQSVQWKCVRCGKQEDLTLISPLSGPRTGPMHPDTRKMDISHGR